MKRVITVLGSWILLTLAGISALISFFSFMGADDTPWLFPAVALPAFFVSAALYFICTKLDNLLDPPCKNPQGL